MGAQIALGASPVATGQECSCGRLQSRVSGSMKIVFSCLEPDASEMLVDVQDCTP
jgi:hypothetical protein